MLQKIKDYLIIALLFLLGVLYYMLGQRNNKLKDAQYKLMQNDLSNEIQKAQAQAGEDGKLHEELLSKYRIKRDLYSRKWGFEPRKRDR